MEAELRKKSQVLHRLSGKDIGLNRLETRKTEYDVPSTLEKLSRWCSRQIIGIENEKM